MSRNDGGPAFPVPMFESRDGAITSGCDGYGLGGMALRDYFATAALSGMLADSKGRDCSSEAMPEWMALVAIPAYRLADAMLKEREK